MNRKKIGMARAAWRACTRYGLREFCARARLVVFAIRWLDRIGVHHSEAGRQ